MTHIDWHQGIRKAHPEAQLTIEGNDLDDLVVTNQETGELFDFNEELSRVAAIEVANEYFLATLRNKRNRLLAETDYLALSDVTLTDDMREYRQALRDLPSNTTDPSNPVWPTKPE